jgi:hypothetical protein
MIPLERAARRLGISVDVLLERLAKHQIAVVGRGKSARITVADVERVAAPVVLKPKQ